MPEPDDSLLDLSAWPAPPSATVASSPGTASDGLPRRPSRPRRRLQVPLGLKGSALVALALGTTVLLVPTPRCGAALAAVLRDPLAPPSGAAPVLDDAHVARDAEAVRAAQAELAAWRSPSPSSRPAPTPSPRTVTVSRVSASEVRAAERDVAVAERAVAADQAELDRLLAEQEEAADPSAYDGPVAAAREELEHSLARLGEARESLRAARSRTSTVVVTTTASARSAPSPRAHAERTVLEQAVAAARRAQAAHLAARQKAVASWRAELRADTARVGAHNAEVRACADRSGVPVVMGLVLLVLGAGGLVRSRLTV